jgi:thermitase
VRRLPLLTCLLALLLAHAVPAAADDAGGQSRSELQGLEDRGVRDIIVAREPGLPAAARGDLRADAGVAPVSSLRLAGTEVVRAAPGGLVEAVDALEADPRVRYAEPNGVVHAATTDPLWPEMWGLENTGQTVGAATGTRDADIDGPEAWALSTGAGETVAVVDSGTTFGHPDLEGAAGVNPGETGLDAAGRDRASNGIDDDGDGFRDDARGWDFVDGDNNPADLNGHGTHVTGTIAARADNAIGVAGVAPAARVLALRVLDADGLGTEADVAAAFDLAGDLKIPIVNASIESRASRTVEAAIAQHPGTLYVVAAGNGGADGTGDDVDATPTFPCALPEPNVVCVGATDATDARAAFSNFGAASVDLFAPGVNIRSTFTSSAGCAPCYALADGTSMATPHVSGTLALMRARNPALGSAALKAELLANVDPRPGLAGLSVSGGRLNAASAVAGSTAPPPAAAAAPSPPAATPPPASAPPASAPAPAPAAGGVARAPVLGRPTITAGVLSAHRPLTIRFTLDRAARVRLTITRAGGAGARTVKVVLQGRAGANRYVLRTELGARRLARGRYRLRLQAIGGARRSRAYTLAFTVR